MRGLYIHIPFCNSICSYCDFPKMVASEELKNEYIDRLIYEIDTYSVKLKDIDSVFIGGGTPNSLSNKNLEKLFIRIEDILKESKENTIELNPELITKELLALCLRYHINRFSIGVESFKEEAIMILNRHHTYDLVKEKMALMREMGIDNVNIDMIFGIPGTTMDDLKDDLKCLYSLNPDHISYYSLILEEKTLFMYQLKNHKLTLLDDDLVADMYDYINDDLRIHGYTHYEVSNYHKGKPSIHNLKYWNLDEYVGVGMGASGNIDGYRYTNFKTLKQYLLDFIEEKNDISIYERKKEYLILGLRLIEGVSISRYKKLFNSELLDDFDLNKYLKLGLLCINNDKLFIPESKMFISNVVLEDII